MKLLRQCEGTPKGKTLYMPTMYTVGDIKAVLKNIKQRFPPDEQVGFTMEELQDYVKASMINLHIALPHKYMGYVIDWMIRVAESERLIWCTTHYMKEAAPVFYIDANLESKMRGRPQTKSRKA